MSTDREDCFLAAFEQRAIWRRTRYEPVTATLPESPRTAAELPATTDLEQGVIEEARRRQRGRRLRVAAAVAVAVIGIAGIVAANMGGGSNRSSDRVTSSGRV